MNDANNLAIILAARAARTVQAADLVVQETRTMALRSGVTNPGDVLRKPMGTRSVHEFLVSRLHRLPQANSLALIDDTGTIVNFSDAWSVPVIHAGDRDFFKDLRDHNDPNPVIGPPVVNRFTKTWAITIARRIDGPNGEFLGVVCGVVAARYFQDFYEGLRAGKSAAASLFCSDGLLLSRYPRIEEAIGRELPRASNWYAVLATGGGAYGTPGYFDHVTRIVSAKPVPDYPLAVAVGMDESAALAPRRLQTLATAAGD